MSASDIVAHEDVAVSDVQPAAADDRMGPVLSVAEGHLERADDIKLLRRGIYQCDIAPFFLVAVEQTVGIGDRTFTVSVGFVHNLARVPVQTHP